jgi:hypothetical protein
MSKKLAVLLAWHSTARIPASTPYVSPPAPPQVRPFPNHVRVSLALRSPDCMEHVQSACVCMCLHVSACVCMCLHVSACVCMCLHVSACIYTYLHVSTCIHISPTTSMRPRGAAATTRAAPGMPGRGATRIEGQARQCQVVGKAHGTDGTAAAAEAAEAAAAARWCWLRLRFLCSMLMHATAEHIEAPGEKPMMDHTTRR